MDAENLPCKIYLSIPLMWRILKFDTPGSGGLSGSTVLHPSLTPTELDDHAENLKDSTLEISVPIAPPEVRIDPTDWHNSCLPPYTTIISSKTPSNKTRTRDVVIPPADMLKFDTAWLWKDLSQLQASGLDSENESVTEPSIGEGFSSWWDFGNL